MLVVLGIVLRMVLKLVYGARGPAPYDTAYLSLNILSWSLLAVGIAPAILFCGMSILGLVLILLAAMAIFEAIVERRAMHRRSTCAILALLVERKAPLEPSLLLEGPYGRGIVSRASRGLLAELRRGAPLSVAVLRHPEALPRAAVAYAAVGAVAGPEVEPLKELAAADDNQLALLRRTCVDRFTYLSSILALLTLVAIFMMIKIIPEYYQIFSEFDLELPSMTLLVISMSAFFVDYLAVPLILMIILAGVTAITVALLYLCDIPILQPLTDRLMRTKLMADVLRMLAVATEQRQSLSVVFDRLAQVYPSALIRRKLQHIASFIAAGDDWRNALRDARFVSDAEYALLMTAGEVQNLPWALRTIARRKERQLVYRWTAAVQVAYPCVILLVGLGVALFSAAMFLPLIKLIEGLA